LVTSVTVSKVGGTHSAGVRISRTSAARDLAMPTLVRSGPRRPPRPATGGARALRAEQPLAVVDVADRSFGRCRGGELAQIRDQQQQVVVRVVARRHLGPGHALAEGLKQPLVAHIGGQERGQVRPPVAGGIHAVAIGTADAVEGHAGSNRVGFAQMRGVRRRIPYDGMFPGRLGTSGREPHASGCP
jgi:hypothetical protein